MVIDTNIFIDHLRSLEKTKTYLSKISNEIHSISSISLFELYAGANTPRKKRDIKLLTDDLIIIPFDEQESEQAAKIYIQLKQENKLIEIRDIFIAATAITNGLSLLTLNIKHFERIKNLKIIKPSKL